MLGGLDRVGGEPLDADLGNLRVLGDHRLQHAGAHLHRLLHQVVEPALLQRRETIDEIGCGGCGRVCSTASSRTAFFGLGRDRAPAIRRRGR